MWCEWVIKREIEARGKPFVFLNPAGALPPAVGVCAHTCPRLISFNFKNDLLI